MMNNTDNTWRNVLKGKVSVSVLMLALFFNSQIFGMACVPCAGVPVPPTSIWSLVATIYATSEIGTTINNASLPFTITTPGIYSLCEDLTWAGAGAAITISTGNAFDPVIINMAGHRLEITGTGNGIVGVGASIFTVYNGTITTSGSAITATLISGAIDVTSVDFASTVTGNINSGIVIPGASVIPNLIPRITNCTFTTIASAITAAATSLQINNCLITGSSLNGIAITGGTGVLELFNSGMGNIGGSCVNFTGISSSAVCIINDCILSNTSTTVPAVVVTGASLDMQTTAIRTPVGVTATGTFGIVAGTNAHIAGSTISGMTVTNSTGLVLSAYDVATVADSLVQDANGINIGGIAITAGDSATITSCSLNALTGAGWFINACNNAVVNGCTFSPTSTLTVNATSITNTENVLVQNCIINDADVTGASIINISAPASGFLQAIVRDCALLDCNSVAAPAALLAVSSTSTVSATYIEGCRIINASNNFGAIGASTIGDVVIRNCSVQNYTSLVPASTIFAQNCNGVAMIECTIEDMINAAGVFASRCQSVLFNRCSIRNMINGFNGVAASLCTHVIITNCTVQNITAVGNAGTLVDIIGSSATPYVIIEGCKVSDGIIQNSSPINSSEVTTGIIRNCQVQNIHVGSITTPIYTIIGLKGINGTTVADLIIENCQVNSITNVGGGAFVANIGEFNAGDGTIRDCTIQNCHGAGMQTGITIQAASSASILSNVLFDLTTTVAAIDLTGVGSPSIFNNVIGRLVLGVPYSPAVGIGGTVVSVAASGGTLPTTTGYWANIAP